MKIKFLRTLLFTALVAATILAACSSKAESNGQEQVLDASYEAVTNALPLLKPNPTATTNDVICGHELVPGQTYRIEIPEGPQEDMSGTYTTIIATRVDAKRTRVQIKTIKLGIIFNSRVRQIEKQRLTELVKLLSKKN